MKAKVNLQLLKTTTFDSGALGLLAMVIHQFHSVGYYQVAIRQQGRSVADTDFVVDEKSEVLQLNIDLARIAQETKMRPDDHKSKREKQMMRVVSPKGYVLFYASAVGGYSVIVSKEDGLIFDSTKLSEGDLFAVSLLEPGNYSMMNRIGSASGAIVVSLTSEVAKQIKTLETRYIDANEKKFDPDRIELASSQGLVFRIKDSAQILITKKDSPPPERYKPIIHWQKFETVKRQSSK